MLFNVENERFTIHKMIIYSLKEEKKRFWCYSKICSWNNIWYWNILRNASKFQSS